MESAFQASSREAVPTSVIVLAHLQPLYPLHIDCVSAYRSIRIWIGGFKLFFQNHQIRSQSFFFSLLYSVWSMYSMWEWARLSYRQKQETPTCHLIISHWFIITIFLSFQWRYYDQSLQSHFYFIVVFTTVKLISQTQAYNLLCKSWWLIINCEFIIVIAEPWYFL